MYAALISSFQFLISMIEIIPSILVSTKEAFLTQIRAVSGAVAMVQIDIADGQFVPNLTWADPAVIEKELEIDCELHLMVANPFAEARKWEHVPQVKRVLVHYESDPKQIREIISQLHSYGWEVGLALNIETPVEVIDELVEELDCVQFMSVHPGKQNQPFLPAVLDKIRAARAKYPTLPIAADGGVNERTIPDLLQAGATRFGPGSAVFDNERTPADNIERMKKLICPMSNQLYDLVIIGGSAAGAAAAIYAARRGLNFVVVAKDTGGEVALSGEVENWPGIIHTTGIELSQNFTDHMKSYQAPIDEGMEVTDIKQNGQTHTVMAKDGAGKAKQYQTKAVLVTSGIHPRAMGVPGEKELRGKGVTSCTVCDGPLFKGKVTATIGAGNSALESALMMGTIAKQVYLISKYPDNQETRGGFPKGEAILIKKVKTLPNVRIIYNANTTEILGSDKVTGLRYEEAPTKEKKELAVDGVMIHVGMIPNDSFISNVKKNSQRELEVNLRCETSIPGIFAAGDITNVPFKQIAIAAGQGVTAALAAIDYINKWQP